MSDVVKGTAKPSTRETPKTATPQATPAQTQVRALPFKATQTQVRALPFKVTHSNTGKGSSIQCHIQTQVRALPFKVTHSNTGKGSPI